MADDPVEIELKLEFPADAGAALRAAPELGEAGADASADRHLVATYFETPDGDLEKAGFSLRIRREGRQHVQTLKVGGKAAGLFVRPEWDRPVRGWTPVLDDPESPFAAALEPAWCERIAPAFVTDVRRHRRTVAFEGARIECAIDIGTVDTGVHQDPLAEVELELLEGRAATLFDLARALDGRAPLRLGVLSKAERGYRALDRVGIAAAGAGVRSEPIRLGADDDAGAAFVAIVTACIRHYRLNEALILTTDGEEPIHQARVALRRLRSAFSLFKPLFGDDPQAAGLRAALRWLAHELGTVRDVDVLIPRVDGEAQAILREERDRRFARLRDTLETARARLLPLDLVEWTMLGGWRGDAGHEDAQRMSAREFARAVLARRYKRVRRRGAHWADLDDEGRHRVRIEAKKLRYAADFFASCFDAKGQEERRAAFVKALSRLQDRLGDLNDMAAGADLLAGLGIDASLPKPGEASGAEALHKAGKAFKRLTETPRFWTA